MSERTKFEKIYPNLFFLSPADGGAALSYLKRKQFLPPHTQLKGFEKAGEGNMNAVLRLITDKGSFIIKQSRPWVAKYPIIAAPFDRILVEMLFYQEIAKHKELSKIFPQLLMADEENRIMVLEDLGEASDFSDYYHSQKTIPLPQVKALAKTLAILHQIGPNADMATQKLQNEAMRQLNHEHIFLIPFLEESAPNLDDHTPGLQAVAKKYRTDENLKEIARALGEQYLLNGKHLLHGDYFPGSWLLTQKGLFIIDPEFGFFGEPSFDLGVMKAHLQMTGHTQKHLETVVEIYEATHGSLNHQLTDQFAGIEIMRRLMGVAQLPIAPDLALKEKLLSAAYQLMMGDSEM